MIVDLSPQIIAKKEEKTLNKPFRTPGGPKKFSVYVKNEKGNIVKVNFGDPNMEIKRDDPDRRRNFRARHNCSNPGPKTKPRYWSCKMWEAGKSVSDYIKGSTNPWLTSEWNGIAYVDHNELLKINPNLAFVEEETNDSEEDEGCGCGNGCGCEEAEAHSISKYSFNNPGEAMKKAKEMGFDDIHTHGDGDDTVFMPGPSHKALIKKLSELKASTEAHLVMYEMSEEEYNEVIGLEDSLAARPGRKSGAQTPAKPNERKKGSSKNKLGSAGDKGGKITFSEKVLNSLKEKVRNHNENSKKKVTLNQLKKVYRRGAGAFSTSHRPGMTRGGWAMARVNMFLKMKRGGKVKDSYRKADGDI